MMNRNIRRGVGVLAMMLALTVPAKISYAAGVPAPPSKAAALSLMCGPQSCARTVLAILNRDRRHAGVAPLSLIVRQSIGAAGCVGSYGHSTAMARSGVIWHVNVQFPRASFPRNICVSYGNAGENVGSAASGNTTADLQTLDLAMMAEPHSAGQCAALANHACNILNAGYHKVGIGVYVSGGTTWLTEDFVG